MSCGELIRDAAGTRPDHVEKFLVLIGAQQEAKPEEEGPEKTGHPARSCKKLQEVEICAKVTVTPIEHEFHERIRDGAVLRECSGVVQGFRVQAPQEPEPNIGFRFFVSDYRH